MKNQAKRCTAGKGAADRELVLEGDFEVKAGYTPLLRLPKKALAAGCYVYALTLAAAMNESRAVDVPEQGVRRRPGREGRGESEGEGEAGQEEQAGKKSKKHKKGKK